MRLIWPAREPRKIVEIADDDLNTEAALYRYATEQLAGFERQKTASKAKLLAAAEDAELLRIPGFNVDVKQDKRGYIRMSVEPADNGVQGEAPAGRCGPRRHTFAASPSPRTCNSFGLLPPLPLIGVEHHVARHLELLGIGPPLYLRCSLCSVSSSDLRANSMSLSTSCCR